MKVDRPEQTGQAGWCRPVRSSGPSGPAVGGRFAASAGLINLTLPLTQPMCEGVTLVAPVGAWPGLSWLLMLILVAQLHRSTELGTLACSSMLRPGR